MKGIFALFLVTVFSLALYANDASFHMSGNHLIPVMETDISVKKEILTLKKISNDELLVTVYYEFMNPKNAKKLLVGFEAASPDRGKNGVAPQSDWHPYITNFTVEMNNVKLPHKITMVADSLYLKNNEIASLTKQQAIEAESQWKESDDQTRFNYVYYFDANFKAGINTVKHTYTFTLTGGIHYNYAFYYILTAAMRWGNKQIDDFTLIVDMGDFQDFCINRMAFGNNPQWMLNGVGKVINKASYPFVPYPNEAGDDMTRFFIRNGSVKYRAVNFRPEDELFLYSPRYYPYSDVAESPYMLYEVWGDIDDIPDKKKRLLRNLPFARRGYIFKTPEIHNYYSGQLWYIPDENYKATMESLTREEQVWVMKWSE